MNDVTTALSKLARPAPAALEGKVLAAIGLADRYSIWPSPVGNLYVAFNDTGVSRVDLAEDDEDFEATHIAEHGHRPVPTDEVPPVLQRRVAKAIVAGRPGQLALDMEDLTEFQRAVLRKAAEIPPGEVRPYGWIAKEIGRPGAVRAVGTALARNPIPVIIPCHRVVKSDGSLGKYSLGDDENKRTLLEAEGMDTGLYEAISSRGIRFTGSDTTQIFCNPTCGGARRTMEEHTVEFHSEAEARAAGYRPCRVCRPVAA